MRTRVVVFALFILHASAALAEVKPPAKYARLLDGAKDQVVRSAFVPDEENPQGEVRLIRRGAAAVMQTVLYSRFLKRVVAEIRKKELASWPPDRGGHEDALRYIGAVLEAQGRIQERYRERGNRGDRTRKMLIEFILSDTASIVVLSEPELEEENGHMRIASARPVAVLELSRAYVRGDFYEIGRDALRLKGREARNVLEPLLPRESGEMEGPSKKEAE